MKAGSQAAGLAVRKTVREDRSALAAMVEAASNLTRDEMDCALELLDIYLENPLQTDYSFVTAVNGPREPAGYACYGMRPLTDAVYDLYWIVVAQGSRRKGVGSTLLAHLEGLLARQGARALVAETSGLPAYDGARRLYLRSGFAEEARIRDFYKPGDDIAFYIKRF